MSLDRYICSTLQRLHGTGTFPRDYSRIDLILSATALGAQNYDHHETIDRLHARIQELEQQLLTVMS